VAVDAAAVRALHAVPVVVGAVVPEVGARTVR